MKYNRNPNYLGEMLIYGSFALIANKNPQGHAGGAWVNFFGMARKRNA